MSRDLEPGSTMLLKAEIILSKYLAKRRRLKDEDRKALQLLLESDYRSFQSYKPYSLNN